MKKEAENRKGTSTMMIARNKLIRRRWNGIREAKFFGVRFSGLGPI
jgi:hypothetical protein